MIEYRIAKGWRIFSALLAAAILIGGLLFIVHSFDTGPAPGSKTALLVLGIVFLPVALFLFAETTVTRLMIDEYSMTLKRAFSTRSIPLKDIEGFVRGEKDSLYIKSGDGGRPIRIPPNIERRTELMEWLKERYPDLNVVEYEKETSNILENDQFGDTIEQREANLKMARKTAGILSVVSVALLFWSIVYPQPFDTLMILVLISPFAGIYAVWYFKGLLRLSARKGSAYPSALYLFVLAVFAVFANVMRGYDLYLFPSAAWRILILLSVGMSVIVIMAGKKALAAEKRPPLAWLLIFLLAGVYSFGLLVFSNCFYDRSIPQEWRVQITGKHISHGKSTTYSLELSPWGRFDDGKRVTVTKSFYYSVETNDSLSVFLRQGKWDIPWYRIAN